MKLSYQGPAGERAEFPLSDTEDAQLKVMLIAGQAPPRLLSEVMGFLARNPAFGAKLVEKSNFSSPLLATTDLILRLVTLQRNPAIQALDAKIADADVSGGLSYLEVKAGNFSPLRERLERGSAVTFYDQAALGLIHLKRDRRRKTITKEVFPRSNAKHSRMLGQAFGVGPVSSAELSAALAPYRQPLKRTGSWKTVAGERKIDRLYQELNKTAQPSDERYEAIRDARIYPIRLSDEGIRQARHRKSRREGVKKSKVQLNADQHLYLSFRARFLKVHNP
jgi:hypothetical protein